jgi:hypothetical protein
MPVTQEDREEMRRDMLEEDRAEEYHEIKMRRDYEFFLDHCGIYNIQEKLLNIRKLCDKYGYDFGDVIDAQD